MVSACSGAEPDARTVEDFGAKGDGRTDDTAALQRALEGVAVGGTLALTRGRTYLHSDVLTLTVADVVLTGGGTLLATEEERSALRIEADGVTLDGVTLGVRATTRRWDAPDQHRLYVAPGRGLVVRKVTVTGSAASGVFLAGVADFRLEDITVKDTRADGIHLSQGSRNGRVLRPRLSGTGDDGVAVVSYLQDGAPCRDIRVDNPVVRGTRGGRGISVVGGEDVTYTDIDVEGSRAAAVYVACEGEPYFTAPSRRVRVVGGAVRGANTDVEIDHGSVLVFAGREGGEVADVEISGLEVSASRPSASWQVGVVTTAGTVSGLRFDDLVLDSPSPSPFNTTAPTCCATDGWTVGGKSVDVSS